MRRVQLMTWVLAGGLGCGMAWGQAAPSGAGQVSAPPSGGAPAGSTGQCKDGSYTTAKQKWQACRGHKGVQAWFAAAAGTATSGTATTAGSAKSSAASEVAPGGGPGMVWVNDDTKVYHCPGSSFYGKTKKGRYMAEADAKSAGYRPDRGKACAK